MNYDTIAYMAENLIEKAGRAISLRKLKDNTTATPWNGMSIDNASEYTELKVFAVNIDPTDTNSRLGTDYIDRDLLKKSMKTYIVAAKTGYDYNQYTHLVDEDIYKINSVQKLKPGNKTIMWYISADRV